MSWDIWSGSIAQQVALEHAAHISKIVAAADAEDGDHSASRNRPSEDAGRAADAEAAATAAAVPAVPETGNQKK